MDLRIKELVDFTKDRFGLSNYTLQEYQFYRNVNISNETIYTLSMEWLPNDTTRDEDGLNPDGTASIDLNLKTRKFERAIFVNNKSFVEDGMRFSNQNKEDIIKWIENETELTYGEQFHLEREEEGEINFKACVNGATVYPPGFIDLQYNKEGKLTLFSKYGEFPSEEQVIEEKYALSLERLEHFEREQLKLIELPSYEQKKTYPIYAIEEIFVANDGVTTIPYEVFAEKHNFLESNHEICWEDPLNIPFERKEIRWMEDLTAEQAFSEEPSPDSFPISADEQEKCKEAVKNLLRQEYPNESGNWVLKTLHRENGYIHATLKANKQDNRVFQRKIKVFIDPVKCEAVNYMDSKLFLETFNDFEISEQVTITHEEAYEKLKPFFELKPYYVYDFKQGQYRLCGKFDCHYGVNASTGEVITLNDL